MGMERGGYVAMGMERGRLCFICTPIRATNFLETCKLLKMEDILPFFSDTATIDPFRVGDTGWT